MIIGHCGGYIVKIGNLIVLQKYEVGRSSDGVQENRRNRLGPLTEIQVTNYAINIYLFRNTWVSFWMGCHSYPKIIVEGPFQACDDNC